MTIHSWASRPSYLVAWCVRARTNGASALLSQPNGIAKSATKSRVINFFIVRVQLLVSKCYKYHVPLNTSNSTPVVYKRIRFEHLKNRTNTTSTGRRKESGKPPNLNGSVHENLCLLSDKGLNGHKISKRFHNVLIWLHSAAGNLVRKLPLSVPSNTLRI